MRQNLAFLSFVLMLAGFVLAQDIEIQVQLTSPLDTEVTRKGDAVSAQVISPAALQGDIVQGKVNDSRSGNKFGGKAVLSFSFDTLKHGGQEIPLSAEIKSISNSKGQQNVDEEGRVVRGSSGNLLKAAAGTGVGALIGGLAGGGKGAAIGAVAGGAASVILIEVAAQGPRVQFAAGSKVLLGAHSRGGPDLASLQPNAIPAASSIAGSTNTTPGAVPSQAAPTIPGSSAQPDLTAIKADFIPGEKTLFYDDFTDMAGDEPPPHWKVRGTVPELKVGAGVRQLTFKGESVSVWPNLKGLPKNFTMELDLTMEGEDESCRPEMEWSFKTKDGGNGMFLRTKQSPQADGWWLRLEAGDDVLGENTFPVNWAQPVKLAIWVQNGRVRLYLNGQRLYDVNQVELPEIASMEHHMWTGVKSVGLRYARFAESTPDFSQAISSSGRYVTHGILFDTDSDRLKAESAPVIKSIARGLETNPNLKLQIEGHTDSTGNALHNMDLSKRRADAVKNVLVSQFKVDAARLGAVGMGAGKPIDTNDTPQGRAQNRRVEFVRE